MTETIAAHSTSSSFTALRSSAGTVGSAPSRRANRTRRRRPDSQRPRPARTGRIAVWRNESAEPAAPARDTLRVVALGGLEEVGRNCMLIEYGNDIVIIDLGLQFPEEDMPGVDYVVPNISYLRGKEQNIRGLIITHGHYDHIGGIPHLMNKLGNPTIYGTALTLGIIAKRETDFRNLPLKTQTVDGKTELQLGKFRVEFFTVTHNIPASVGVIIHTPLGILVHTGDFKIDLSITDPNSSIDIGKIGRLHDENVLMLLADSTNATQTGHQLEETEIQRNIDEIIRNAPGRIFIATFASLLGRLQQIINAAERLGRKVALDGYGIKSNVAIAQELGYMTLKKETLIPVESLGDYSDEKVLVLCTGAQGEDRAVLNRLVNGEHRTLKLQPKDTVVFSSSIVPGNERSVQRLKDALYRHKVEVIHYQMMDVHAGGHAKQEDLKLMYRLVNPKYYMPIEGNHSFLRVHAKMIEKLGHNPERMFVADNGQVVSFKRDGNDVVGELTTERVPTDYVMVDGLGVGDVGQVVLRDRQLLAEDGMVVVIATIEGKTGKLIGSPDIISRGFIHMKENKELVERLRAKIKKILVDHEPKMAADDDEIRGKLRNDIGQFLFTLTERRPMILPVIIKV